MINPVHATSWYALVGCQARRALVPPLVPERRLPDRVEAVAGKGEARTFYPYFGASFSLYLSMLTAAASVLQRQTPRLGARRLGLFLPHASAHSFAYVLSLICYIALIHNSTCEPTDRASEEVGGLHGAARVPGAGE
jgi:hypothetical protein